MAYHDTLLAMFAKFRNNELTLKIHKNRQNKSKNSRFFRNFQAKFGKNSRTALIAKSKQFATFTNFPNSLNSHLSAYKSRPNLSQKRCESPAQSVHFPLAL